MGEPFMSSKMYLNFELHEKLRYDIEETLASGDQGDLLIKVIKEFAGNKMVLERIKVLYERHYDELYGE
jgi:hypothetical protein